MIKSILVVVLSITIMLGLATYNEVYGTGGGKDIAGLIQPMIDRAMQYINDGNTDAALEELETIQNELKDTFELED